MENLDFDVEFMPANTTKHLQPMDISVNRPFKGYIAELWEEYTASLEKMM